MSRKTMEGRLFIGRRKGRPRLRWVDDVVADLIVMKLQQWMEKTKEREQWRLVVEEAKAHPVLKRREDGGCSGMANQNFSIPWLRFRFLEQRP